jgi:hypothetical protein
MTVSILRFAPGSCGDTLLKLILDNDPSTICDFKFNSDPLHNGATTSSRNNDILKLFPCLINIENLEDTSQLENVHDILDRLNYKKQKFIFKCHCYKPEFNKLLDFTIDINVSEELYPFVAGALVAKNWANGLMLDVVQSLESVEMRVAMSWYIIARRQIAYKRLYSSKQIKLEDVLFNYESCKSAMTKVGFDISNEEYYLSWYKKQKIFLPSEQYVNYVKTNNYNWLDTKLSLVERYCLQSLDNVEFQFLEY